MDMIVPLVLEHWKLLAFGMGLAILGIIFMSIYIVFLEKEQGAGRDDGQL
jgi:hypothetical protein